MLVGLLSGAVAAILASLVSLPLKSPDDAFFNTASVTLGALLAGAGAGALRAALPARMFAIAWAAAFVATSAALLLAPLDGMLSFGVPLAAIVFAITGAGVLAIPASAVPRMPVAAGGAATVALAIGLGLSGQGDAESGALSLPPVAVVGTPAGASASPSGTASGSPTGTASTTATATRGADGLPTRFAAPADLKGVTFVVGEGSRATFTVTEKLAQLSLPNDAVMRSTALTGEVRLDGRPSRVALDLQKLSSDQDRRDQFVRRSLFTQAPTAVLTVPALSDLPDRYESGQVVKRAVPGTLAINGVERPITFDVEARLDGAVLNILGRTSFVWKDFNMTPPNTPAVTVQDRVSVEVLLVSKAQPG